MRFLLSFFILLSSIAGASEQTQNQQAIEPPFLADASISGNYYFNYYSYTRDANIGPLIKGTFYFRFFIAKAPVVNNMSVQMYNEVDGVATFDDNGVASYSSPHGNCLLTFYFKPTQLTVTQKGSCGMPSELGLEVQAVYTQLENY